MLAFGSVVGQLNTATKWWVEKTPLNEYSADVIFELWPEARMLHIVRDPRDNFSSYERKHPDWTPQHFARKWRRSTRAGIEHSQRFGIDRYLMINYEHLVSRNSEVINQICAFLEIEFEDILLQPTKVGRGWKANTMFDQDFEQVSSAPVGRWKNILSKFEADVVEVITAKQMKARGYDLAGHWGLWALVYGTYWRLRQDFYFRLGSGRDEKGFI